EFTTLTKRVAVELGVEDAGVFAPDTALAARRKSEAPSAEKADYSGEGGALGALTQGLTQTIDRARYQIVTDGPALDALIARALEGQHLAFSVEADSADPMRAQLTGIALALGPGDAHYIPLGHRAGTGLDLDGRGGVEQLKTADVIARIKPLF